MCVARRTKYSDVLPEGSFTPPPKIVLEVETTWPWLGRWLLVAAPPFRMVVPRSQPFALERDMITVTPLVVAPDVLNTRSGNSAVTFPLTFLLTRSAFVFHLDAGPGQNHPSLRWKSLPACMIYRPGLARQIQIRGIS